MRRHLLITPALTLAVCLGACGDDSDSSGGSGGTGAGNSGGTGGAVLDSGDEASGGTGGSVDDGGDAASGGTGGSSHDGGDAASGGYSGEPATPVTPYIVIDQFGYIPDDEKIAVVRDPQTGWDADESFTPGATYALVNENGEQVLTGTVEAWNGGAEDDSSGDRAFWFDFSSITTPGYYYVLDVDRELRTPVFRISEGVYLDVLRHAVRTFFYQRAGQDKTAVTAGPGWVDGPSHVGALQDHNCRLYSSPDDASTERDLWGGWYDAGDFNKYTNWHASYVLSLLRAYAERPSVWGDDYDIPESGNGIPDILDEAKWGMDWLIRMQNTNGSVLSIVGESHASPPSAATGQSLYGSASTSATLSTAAAFAYGSTVFGEVGNAQLTTYADDLRGRAEDAWTWAAANPNALFYNNSGSSGTSGLGAGQQETDDDGRLFLRLQAACYLFEATGTSSYRNAFDAEVDQIHLLAWGFAYPFELSQQELLLHYASLPAATASVASDIESTYLSAMESAANFGAHEPGSDPYLAFISDYTWGSNATKASQGMMFRDIVTFGLDPSREADARRAAARYLHYLHGVNPFGLVYLSNMASAGASRSVTEFYHTWFANGSALWDSTVTSTYGPPPGFLTGGPNPSYGSDGCCPSGCGSAENNAICTSESLEPPRAQPAQKSYKDFNTQWPLNSWEVTENSNGYQSPYIRLLSAFVP